MKLQPGAALASLAQPTRARHCPRRLAFTPYPGTLAAGELARACRRAAQHDVDPPGRPGARGALRPGRARRARSMNLSRGCGSLPAPRACSLTKAICFATAGRSCAGDIARLIPASGNETAQERVTGSPPSTCINCSCARARIPAALPHGRGRARSASVKGASTPIRQVSELRPEAADARGLSIDRLNVSWVTTFRSLRYASPGTSSRGPDAPSEWISVIALCDTPARAADLPRTLARSSSALPGQLPDPDRVPRSASSTVERTTLP